MHGFERGFHEFFRRMGAEYIFGHVYLIGSVVLCLRLYLKPCPRCPSYLASALCLVEYISSPSSRIVGCESACLDYCWERGRSVFPLIGGCHLGDSRS